MKVSCTWSLVAVFIIYSSNWYDVIFLHFFQTRKRIDTFLLLSIVSSVLLVHWKFQVLYMHKIIYMKMQLEFFYTCLYELFCPTISLRQTNSCICRHVGSWCDTSGAFYIVPNFPWWKVIFWHDCSWPFKILCPFMMCTSLIVGLHLLALEYLS